MPGPFFGAIAGTAGSIVAHAAFNPVMNLYNSWTNAVTLPAKYNAMRGLRTSLPDPQQMVDLWNQNLATDDGLKNGLNAHNIAIFQEQGDGHVAACSEWWNRVLAASAPKLTLEQLLYCYWSGIINDAQWNDLARAYKMRPGHQALLNDLTYAKFTEQTIFPLFYRGRWNETNTVKKIRRLFGCQEDDAKDILYSSEYVPPPSDLIRFAVRDVFNPDPKVRNPLQEEFSDNKNLRDWFYSQGIKDIEIRTKQGQLINLDMPMAYWMAHWILPSPTQAYEMLHRLRPDGDRYKRYGIDGLEPFTMNELNRILKSNDYSPEWRKSMAAISFIMPRLIDIRNMYKKDIIDDAEMKEKLLDRGYGPADANEVAAYWKLWKEEEKDKERERKYAKTYGRWRTQILNAYKVGSLNRTQALDALLFTEMDVDEANLALNAIDVEVNASKARQFVQMTKSAFYLGAYDGFQAYNILLDSGISPQRSTDYVQVWQRQMTLPRKTLSARLIVEYVTDGRLPIEEARLRLENLGYGRIDQALMLDEALDKAAEKRLKIENQIARTEKQQIEAARRLQERQAANARRALKELASIVTLPRMERWYALGLIEKSEILSNLLQFGWPQDDAQRAIDAIPER